MACGWQKHCCHRLQCLLGCHSVPVHSHKASSDPPYQSRAMCHNPRPIRPSSAHSVLPRSGDANLRPPNPQTAVPRQTSSRRPDSILAIPAVKRCQVPQLQTPARRQKFPPMHRDSACNSNCNPPESHRGLQHKSNVLDQQPPSRYC